MNGISFIIRVKNEENVIGESIRSITGLTIPHDIHVILNNCTDKTAEIVEDLKNQGMPISIYTYDHQISRAGYECLITDSTSPHSLVAYYKWCFGKATYPWIFKWDADFLMTDELRRLLNSHSWKKTEKHTRVYLPAKNQDSDSAEHNLFCGPYDIIKYIYWEYITPIGDVVEMDPEGAYMIHSSDLKTPKSYWFNEPWFMTDTSDEAAGLRVKYDFLNTFVGKEPFGSARRSNPEAASYHYFRIKNNEAILGEKGIYLYK